MDGVVRDGGGQISYVPVATWSDGWRLGRLGRGKGEPDGMVTFEFERGNNPESRLWWWKHDSGSLEVEDRRGDMSGNDGSRAGISLRERMIGLFSKLYGPEDLGRIGRTEWIFESFLHTWVQVPIRVDDAWWEGTKQLRIGPRDTHEDLWKRLEQETGRLVERIDNDCAVVCELKAGYGRRTVLELWNLKRPVDWKLKFVMDASYITPTPDLHLLTQRAIDRGVMVLEKDWLSWLEKNSLVPELSVDDSELEAYRLLGEELPFFWAESKFNPWVESR